MYCEPIATHSHVWNGRGFSDTAQSEPPYSKCVSWTSSTSISGEPVKHAESGMPPADPQSQNLHLTKPQDIIFRQLFCSEKHQEQISIYTWSVKNVLMVLRNNFCFAGCRANQKKTKEKLSKNFMKRYLDLSLIFVCCFSDLFFHQLIIKCHVSIIARPPKRKHLFTKV